MIKITKKGEYVTFENYERKKKLSFMIYDNFESILAPKHNGKQNPDELYTNKYKRYDIRSYGYKLVCVNHKFSKYFKSYLGEDAV